MTPQAIETIQQILEELFNKTRLKVLGPQYAKALGFSVRDFDPHTTLTSTYLHALSQHAIDSDAPDSETVDTMNTVFDSLLSKLENQAKTNISSVVQNYTHTANTSAKIKGLTTDEFLSSDEGQDLKASLYEDISKEMTKINGHMNLLVTNEMHKAQNLGALDGIINVSKHLNIEDPTVFKIGVLDEKMCKACRKLWHRSDNIAIPRLWKLSQLKGGYENLKNPQGTILPTHPHCRHVLTVLMPGFGFDESGSVVYKGQGHIESLDVD